MTGRLVLVRHGQSSANVARELDTRPPGAPLTDLGHQQARDFAAHWEHPIGLLAHSTALRAIETAADVGAQRGLAPIELPGIHEVQVGELEARSDDAAHEEFNAVYRLWHEGSLDVHLPGGESARQVLDRYVPVVTELRVRYLDDHDWTGDVVVVSHGAAIRLVGAVLAGVDPGFAIEHHLANTECVVLSPITDGRWSCVQWSTFTPPFEPVEHPVDDTVHSGDPMG
ncbi:phosphoglycerate mutase [Mycolicibacterium madagascariense]|uniref:Phosphoglycerate mutase n=1 Tax=Mycolicibacterium madagascariense TaxID=212765 RepID=A0A7I7XNS6_9MYCO|nr:histidine phosphatase family protein [Mycolicibacterium madagascariense]MCV7012025.1 histidine phosphatase family protein [Mycolicibacterium madagascariense]BBZ30898.1 phosphoglycerate mutase [Mycolicibacterium madagascariense]